MTENIVYSTLFLMDVLIEKLISTRKLFPMCMLKKTKVLIFQKYTFGILNKTAQKVHQVNIPWKKMNWQLCYLANYSNQTSASVYRNYANSILIMLWLQYNWKEMSNMASFLILWMVGQDFCGDWDFVDLDILPLNVLHWRKLYTRGDFRCALLSILLNANLFFNFLQGKYSVNSEFCCDFLLLLSIKKILKVTLCRMW